MQNTRTFNRVGNNTRKRTATAPRSAVKSSPLTRLAKKILKRTKFQLLAYVGAFFLLPAILPAGAETVLLTLFYPMVCLFLSCVYGYKYGFIKHYLAIPVALFLIATFINFSPFSFLYGLCYLLVSVIALTFGTIYRQLCK